MVRNCAASKACWRISQAWAHPPASFQSSSCLLFSLFGVKFSFPLLENLPLFPIIYKRQAKIWIWHSTPRWLFIGNLAPIVTSCLQWPHPQPPGSLHLSPLWLRPLSITASLIVPTLQSEYTSLLINPLRFCHLQKHPLFSSLSLPL